MRNDDNGEVRKSSQISAAIVPEAWLMVGKQGLNSFGLMRR
jgi:hypothetical protein